MNLLALDFETYYSADYSLSKMTTEAYVRDPRFEVILVSVKFDDAAPMWILRDRFEQLCDDLDWSQFAIIAHHAHFDGLILSHHFDVRPALWIDTLSMARVIDGPKAGNSLEALAPRHGLGEKGKAVYWAKGKHLADFSVAELHAYGDYCNNDNALTYSLAQKFLPLLPEDELRLIDLTVRMFTEPVLCGDLTKLETAVYTENQRRVKMLYELGLVCGRCHGSGRVAELLGEEQCMLCNGSGVNKKPIGSNEQFADLLRKHGVEPETKTSPATGEQIYAFAKTDPAMQALLEDENDEVRALAEARIAVKSNIIQTRAQRYLECAQRGPMPVYINHAGAHTLRVSGGDSMNWLNMSNENEHRPELAVLKQSLQAPEGHRIVAVDSSQGEARILAWEAGQHDLVEAFAQGRDVYSEHASMVYGRPVDRKKVKADFVPGQVGKVSILSMGFGAGWYKTAMELLKGMLGAPPIQFNFEDMQAMKVDPSPFLNNSRKVGMVNTMPSRLELNDRFIHCIVAEAIVTRYRAKMQAIAGKNGFWQVCEAAINAMIEGREMVFGAHGVFRTAKDRIWTPKGLWLDYREIARDEGGEATYFDGRKRTKIYGGLLTENLVQHTHRIIVSDQMLEISARYKVALMTYDEVVCVVPEAEAQAARQYMIDVMARSPAWAPGLPLMAEGGIGSTYAEAK